jgi:hypothetical protein
MREIVRLITMEAVCHQTVLRRIEVLYRPYIVVIITSYYNCSIWSKPAYALNAFCRYLFPFRQIRSVCDLIQKVERYVLRISSELLRQLLPQLKEPFLVFPVFKESRLLLSGIE